ncbi:hypothetical protein HDU67_007258 [Dinochytrium kinnereticum]|nr:hypothetical protein HDU67_007258 [Dinochytrium kinnereticum]
MAGIARSELQFTTFRGLTIRGTSWGDKDNGVKVLALHGWLDNAGTWDNLIPLLFDSTVDRFYFVCLDLAGHGLSEHRAGQADYALHTNVEDVVAVVDSLVRYLYKMRVSHNDPLSITKLILIEALGPYTINETAPKSLMGTIKRYRERKVSDKRVFETLDDASVARQNGIHKLTKPAADLLITRGTQSSKRGRGFEWSSDHRLRLPSPVRFTAQSGLEFVKAIKAPVLTIWAQGESEIRFYDLEKRLASLDRVLAVSLPGNHHLHLEPDTVAAVTHIILGFLGYRDDYSLPQMKTISAKL